MANELAALSQELATAVERAGKSVAAVHARPRFSSSGALWRPGIIVTAEHTIRREEEITVTLPDGSNVPATLAGSDPGTDLAVLRVEGNTAGQPVSTGGPAAQPAPGNLALAIGRSQDSGVNATWGIVSAVSGPWRTWRGGRLDAYIRLDLTLYPGSSGGLVVNIDGAPLGIATSALSRIAGLAIPASTIDRVVDEIVARGRVARGYLGVGLQPVELPDHQKGLIVLSVEPGGPAANAGVLIGDILIALGGRDAADTDDVQMALEAQGVGQSVEATVVRGGKSQIVNIKIGERPRRS
jgi:S1-C subfamily serine protease